MSALALALPFYWHRNLATTLPPEKSIAVLPFVDLSEAKDQEYFCDGISEEILNAIGEGRRAACRWPHLVIFIQGEERQRERGWEKAKRRECA